MNNLNNITNLVPVTEPISVVQSTDIVVPENPIEVVNCFKSKQYPNLNPFCEVEIRDLVTADGLTSMGKSVRIPEMDNLEISVKTSKYLLVSNTEIASVGNEIRKRSEMNWKPEKIFFDGKTYRRSFVCEDSYFIRNIPKVGDQVALVMEEVNSYDGNTMAGIYFYYIRLICDNGMRSRDYGFSYSFRHTMNNLDWESKIDGALLKLAGNDLDKKFNRFLQSCSFLQNMETEEAMTDLLSSKEYLMNLPITQYGQISHNMHTATNTDEYGNVSKKYGNSLWDFFNSGTELLTHNPIVTQGSMNNNSVLVDGLLRYASDMQITEEENRNQVEMFN